jgi:hypothetical protein
MQDDRRIWALAIFGLVNGGMIACVGGGGGLSSSLETWDSPPSSPERAPSSGEGSPTFLERAQGSTESPSRSGEAAPGTHATGGPTSGAGKASFECSGTFVCQEVGKTSTDTITLTQVGGTCTVEDSVIEPDGRVTSKGKNVGRWSATSTGFIVVTSEGTIVCTSGGLGQGSSSSGSTPTQPPTTTPTPAPADAG